MQQVIKLHVKKISSMEILIEQELSFVCIQIFLFLCDIIC